jgi:acetolactate synthase-1/2/3 large subunit
MKVTGADALAAILEQAGIDVVSGIPGHTITDFALAVGARDNLQRLLPRHEATSAFAADVYYRVSGRMMAIFTHAFPGAGNALTAVANAYADYSALLWINGNTASVGIGRGGFQELSRQIDDDLTQLMRPAVKRVWQPRGASDLAHNTLAALKMATSGRPGPVALNVSQEVWAQEIDVPAIEVNLDKYVFSVRPRPDAESVERAAALLAEAKRPAILVGNGVNLARARAELRAFAARHDLPVVTTASGKGAFPETDVLSSGIMGWVGTGTGNFTTRNADILLVLGARLSEQTASSWVEGMSFSQHTKIIQADIEESGIGNSYPVEVPLIGHLASTIEDLSDALAHRRSLEDRSEWKAAIDNARIDWEAVALASQDPGETGHIGPGAVVQALRRAYPGPVNLVNDCGKHHKWILQQFEARDDDYIISSMGGASMGIGLPGAIGAHLARPDAPTISWLGDGGLAMSLSALPTITEYRLPIVIVVIDDASYGVVHNTQMSQAGRTAFADFDGSGTNPDYRLDFSAVAEACGIPGFTVSDPAKIDDAFAWAKAQNGPALITIQAKKSAGHPSGGGTLKTLNDRSSSLVWKG